MKCASAAVAVAVLVGCGGGSGQKATAPVKGTVLCDGEAVSGGRISFSPVGDGSGLAGKGASGEVMGDGTFVLTTYDDGDGAVIGKHVVVYDPPEVEAPPSVEGEPEKEVSQPKEHDCHLPEKLEVEVTKGENSFEIKVTHDPSKAIDD